MKLNQDVKISLGIALFTVLVFVGIIALARSNSAESEGLQASNPSLLLANEVSFDFGTISMAKGKVSYAFKIKNPTTEPITLTKIYTSCMCTTASLLNGSKKLGPFGMPGHGAVPRINSILQPGEEADLEVVFDPAAHGPAGVGKIERAVYVESKSSVPLEFGFTAMVTP